MDTDFDRALEAIEDDNAGCLADVADVVTGCTEESADGVLYTINLNLMCNGLETPMPNVKVLQDMDDSFIVLPAMPVMPDTVDAASAPAPAPGA